MSMKLEVVKVIGKKEIEKVMNSDLSKSSKMKELFKGGLDVKEIKSEFDNRGSEVRYNFVYNVVSNMVNVNGLEVVKVEKGSKKSKIIELLESGKSKVEISRELGVNYNMVYKYEKDWKLLKERKLNSK